MSSQPLKKAFLAYCNFGAGTGSRKEELESRNFKKMCQTSKLLNKGRLNMAELDMIFTRARGTSRTMSFPNFTAKAVPQLAQAAFGSSAEENVAKVKDMICKSQPGLNTNLSMSNDDVVGRLTDVQGYTGAHRARFDPATGRGRGLEGRTDRPDNAGYVTGYKNQGTYGKK